MDFFNAKKLIERKFKDSKITVAFELKNLYIFSIIPKDWPSNDTILDAFFSVNKTSGDIKEWNPSMDIESFKIGINNPIYKEV